MTKPSVFLETIGIVLLLFFIVVFFCLVSCVDSTDTLVTYTIPAGQHYSVPRTFGYIDQIPMRFYAKFDESAIYDVGEDDINKLYGFTDCNSLVHRNSARIGWRWWDNELQLFSYTYAGGIRNYQYIKSVPLNEWIKCEITFTDNRRYRICVEGTCVESPRGIICGTGIYTLLTPYFGGDNTTDHDIKIQIR